MPLVLQMPKGYPRGLPWMVSGQRLRCCFEHALSAAVCCAHKRTSCLGWCGCDVNVVGTLWA